MIKAWLKENLKGDYQIWLIVFLLSVQSLLVVYSATGTYAYKTMRSTEFYLFKHGMLVVLSLVLMYVCHRLDYRFYARLSKLALWASVALLLYAFAFGSKVNEANRWITIPVINQTFQPSDLAKLALITSLAAMLAKRQHLKYDTRLLLPMVVWCILICGCIALTNASTAILLLATCFLLMFIGRVPAKFLALLLVGGLVLGGTALAVGQRFGTVQKRIERFFDKKSVEFQTEQGYIAIVNGGVTGRGPGQSLQRNFLPHPYSDFIFAVIIEEYGLLGGLFTLFLYLWLLYRGMKAVANSDRAFGGLLSAGLSFSLVIQALINMAVATGLVPVTGLPLPLVSMGGTSLLFTGIAIGIILSVSREGEPELKPAL